MRPDLVSMCDRDWKPEKDIETLITVCVYIPHTLHSYLIYMTGSMTAFCSHITTHWSPPTDIRLLILGRKTHVDKFISMTLAQGHIDNLHRHMIHADNHGSETTGSHMTRRFTQALGAADSASQRVNSPNILQSKSKSSAKSVQNRATCLSCVSLCSTTD